MVKQRSHTLLDDVMHDVSVDVGQAIVASLMAIGKAFVVDAEEVKAGGVEVVDVNFVFGDAESKFVGGTVGESALHTSTRHPDAEAFLVVVASGWRLGTGAGTVFLHHRRAAEFAAPDDEGVVEESPLFQVGEQTGAGLVDFLSRPWKR